MRRLPYYSASTSTSWPTPGRPAFLFQVPRDVVGNFDSRPSAIDAGASWPAPRCAQRLAHHGKGRGRRVSVCGRQQIVPRRAVQVPRTVARHVAHVACTLFSVRTTRVAYGRTRFLQAPYQRQEAPKLCPYGAYSHSSCGCGPISQSRARDPSRRLFGRHTLARTQS